MTTPSGEARTPRTPDSFPINVTPTEAWRGGYAAGRATCSAAGRRLLPLTDRAVSALAAANRDAVYIFHSRGRPLNPSTVQRHFALIVEEAGLGKVRLHDLRHSFITRALAHGASLDDVRRLAGHSSIRITADMYAHRVEARLREAVRTAGEAVG